MNCRWGEPEGNPVTIGFLPCSLSESVWLQSVRDQVIEVSAMVTTFSV